MQVILDIKPSYYNQVMTVLHALDKRFFTAIEIPKIPSASNISPNSSKKFSAASISTKGFKFDRDEANER